MSFNGRSILHFLTIFLVVVAVAGCQRQRAENSLKKTQQKLSEIKENYNGQEFAPNEIQSIESKLDQANNALEADAGTALSTAQQAGAEADQLLEKVKPQHASTIFTEAQREIDVARINDLPRNEPDRFRRILEAKSEADTAKQDNEWDEVIELSQNIIDEVRTGLASLRTEADRRQIDSEQSLTTLTSIGGNIYTPEVVIGVRNDIQLARRISEEDRDYVLAANKFSEAKNKAENGIIQVLREKSLEAIQSIEGYLTEALLEGAKQFKPDEYEDANELYQGITTRYQEGKFNEVIESSKLLITRAQTLVTETKRAASDDRIATMQENIQELENGGILEYIPGSTDQLRALLAEAQTIRQQDTEEAFDQIKEINIDASDEYDRQRNAFQTLAQDAIRSAKNALERSRAVFDQMESLFDPVGGEMTAEQTAFENQKESRRIELGKRLEEANNNLVTADLRQQQGSFKGAIVLSKEVEEKANDILSEIYHVVAHNASIELANLISRYEKDGAREYAEDELQRSYQNLDEVKQLIVQGQYKAAVERAAEARADVELMAQQIAGRATNDLRTARSALLSADSENTKKYRGEQLTQVQNLIEEAEASLQQDKLKMAVETARRATNIARTAENEANQLAAEEQIAEASGMILEAQTAGAEIYAGREVEEARRLVTSSRVLFDSGEYVKAEELATSSFNRARAALYKKINEAEAEVANAEAVGAWEYDYARLANASTQVRDARGMLEEDRYSDSASRADSAKEDAAALVVDAKRYNFKNRVKRIKNNLDKGADQGINFFQPEESIAIRRKLTALQNEYSSEDYERIMTEIEKVEAGLRLTLDRTDELVLEVASQLENKLDDLEEAGALLYAAPTIASARNSLKYARLDYRRGLYKAAHTNLNKAVELTHEVEMKELRNLYTEKVQSLFNEYQDVQQRFANVLTLDPRELKELAVDVNGDAQSVAISSRLSPLEFSNEIDRLYSIALDTRVPNGLEKLHEAVLEVFIQARLGSAFFEKLLIIDRLPTGEAYDIIDSAYFRTNQSNRLMEQIQRQLTSYLIEDRFVLAETGVLVNSLD